MADETRKAGTKSDRPAWYDQDAQPKAGGVTEEERLSGPTHVDDATYLGVPMAAADKPTDTHDGPEDALDPNTRGDYSGRLGGSDYQPHAIRPKAEVGDDGATVEVEEQRPLGESSKGGKKTPARVAQDK